MRLGSLLPDTVTLLGVLAACASLGAIRVGSSFHAYAIKNGLLFSSVYVGTSLLDFYSKCGDIKSSRRVFDGMRERNTSTWSAMIGGYGANGESGQSLALFNDMLKVDLKPNEAAFTSILSACSHTGMVDKGWRYFNSMCHDYNFVPSMNHYACMVDMLARSNRLEEAFDLIDSMRIQPDASVLGAFLHGCKIHSRFDLGEVATRKLLEFFPGEASYYVLVSNLYASDGRWSEANEMRELMKRKGLSKSPVCSLMEMKTCNDFPPRSVASMA